MGKNVLYSTGKINLDWKTLMSKIRTNLEGFVESGAWDFLLETDENHQVSDNDDDNTNNRIPSEDEYVPSDDDYESDDYSDDDDDDDDDDYESDEYSDDDLMDSNGGEEEGL